MKFENWRETHERGKRAKEEIASTRVSQGTRQMASDPANQRIHLESAVEEYDRLIQEKMGLEREIAVDFSRAAFTEAQSKIRRQYANGQGGLGAWLKHRTRMERDREKRVQRIKDIEQRIGQIKGRVKEERRNIAKISSESESIHVPLAPILEAILEELKAIRLLIRE
jgi:hypothetical protein